jgi:hypothetical protein
MTNDLRVTIENLRIERDDYSEMIKTQEHKIAELEEYRARDTAYISFLVDKLARMRNILNETS